MKRIEQKLSDINFNESESLNFSEIDYTFQNNSSRNKSSIIKQDGDQLFQSISKLKRNSNLLEKKKKINLKLKIPIKNSKNLKKKHLSKNSSEINNTPSKTSTNSPKKNRKSVINNKNNSKKKKNVTEKKKISQKGKNSLSPIQRRLLRKKQNNNRNLIETDSLNILSANSQLKEENLIENLTKKSEEIINDKIDKNNSYHRNKILVRNY